MGRLREHRLAVVGALVLVQVLFGIHYLAAKILLVEIPPRTWAVLRVVAAGAVLWGIVLARRTPLPRDPRDIARLALYSLFGVVINQVCFVEGLRRTTPIHSSLINTGIPVLTLVFAVALGRERAGPRKLLAFAVALVGVMLVIRPDRAGLGDATLVGDLLTVVNATSFALFLVLSKRVLSRTDPLAATAILFGFGSAGILALGWPQLRTFEPLAVPPVIWAIGVFIVLGATVGTYLLNYWSLRRVESSVVALFVYLQPVVAGLLSVTLRGERPEATTLIGGALICAGVYLATIRR
jgi:drug/metabolite transporter (DMT)-like permease